MAQVRRRRAGAKRENPIDEERQRRTDYRMVFGTEAGQRVLADILRLCAISQTTFVPGAPDLSAFNEGKRRVALEVVEVLTADPDALLRLMQSGETGDIFNDDAMEAGAAVGA